jgi:hypothetical protein
MTARQVIAGEKLVIVIRGPRQISQNVKMLNKSTNTPARLQTT